MKNPNLLIISNRFVAEDLDEGLNGRIISWDEEEFWPPIDRDVVIIDFSFNEKVVISSSVYDGIMCTLSSTEEGVIAKGLIVMVICGYPDDEIELMLPLLSPPEEKPIEQQRGDILSEKRKAYIFLLELLGNSIYNKLSFYRKVENYERRKVTSPFKEYFNLTDNIVAHLLLEESPSNPDHRIKAISKAGGVERNYYVSAIIWIGKGSIILLPGYNQYRKREALLALIKISNKFYRRKRNVFLSFYNFLKRRYI